jgi:hypothetical protein
VRDIVTLSGVCVLYVLMWHLMGSAGYKAARLNAVGKAARQSDPKDHGEGADLVLQGDPLTDRFLPAMISDRTA